MRGYEWVERFYGSSIMRWTSPDTIIPNEQGINSSLTVDYHETQFLELLNKDNRREADNRVIKKTPVPSDPLSFDRYSYVLNNPLKYTDPTGHCLWDLCVLEIAGVSLGLAELSVIIGGGAAALALSSPQGQEALTSAIAQSGQAVSNELTSLFARGEYVPPSIHGEAERNAYREAVHKYKQAFGLGAAQDVPKWILDKIAELLKKGVKPEDIPYKAPEPPEEDNEMEEE